LRGCGQDPGTAPAGVAILDAVRHLPAGSFAFVMATGIVSIAAERQAFHRLALVLFAIDAVAFLLLALLSLVRLLREPAAVFAKLSRHETGAGFLTLVAAAGILGNQFALLTPYPDIAAGLWLAASVFWAALVYAHLTALTIRPGKPPLDAGLDGSWLLLVVASESLAVLGTHVANLFGRPDVILYLSLCWFLLGGWFYLVVIVLILYRWWFAPMRPAQLTPPYWINMGAVAIATLAGARLEMVADGFPWLARLVPVITAAAAASWTLATWWIPLLLTLSLWRHAIRGVPLSYRVEYWSMVFPLGMYTVATWAFAHATGLDFLDVIPECFLWIAFAAWVATFYGMVRQAAGPLRA
jgi:tellurite resistance protein TehA-like permease